MSLNNKNIIFASQDALLSYVGVNQEICLVFDHDFDSSATLELILELIERGKIVITHVHQESYSGIVNKNFPSPVAYKKPGATVLICLRSH